MISLHYLALVVAIVGLVIYALPWPDHVKRVGLVSFGVGLLAFLGGR